MNLNLTARLYGMSIIAFLFVSMATAQTLPFDSIKAKYTNDVAKVDSVIQKQKNAVLAQYGKDIESWLSVMTKKGDLQGYKLVEKEMIRFKEEKTIGENSTQPDLVALVETKKRELESIDLYSKQNEFSLMKDYVASLNNLVKSLMIQKKIQEAEVVDSERVSYTKMLADLEASIPKKETVVTAKPKTTELKKLTSSEKINLAGKWHRNLKSWDFEFKANGTFRCLNSTDTGTWKVNGKTVTMHWTSGTTIPDRSYTLEGYSTFSGDSNGLGSEIFTRVEEKEISSIKDSKKPSVPADALEYKGHHYLVGEKKLTWSEAKLDSEKRGGHLVIIKDKEEQDFVISFLLKAGIRFVWIGAEYKNLRWQWVDGISFDSNMWANKIKPKDASNPVLFLDTSEGIKGSKNNVDGWYVIEWDE